MALRTTARSSTGPTRRELELRRIALNKDASPEERARAITSLGRLHGTIPPPLAQIRRGAIAALAEQNSLSEIARLIGLSERSGRVCQLLTAHRAQAEVATDGTA